MFKENCTGEKFQCDILHSYRSLFLQSNPLCPRANLQKSINKYPFLCFPCLHCNSGKTHIHTKNLKQEMFIFIIWKSFSCTPLSIPTLSHSKKLINISSRRRQVFSKCSFKLQDQSNQYEYVEYYDKIILFYLVCTVSLVQILRFCISLALKPHHTIFRKPD
jgi:hypothetical protein